ncbi:unnamed protein product [Chrysoparadoxa australica]
MILQRFEAYAERTRDIPDPVKADFQEIMPATTPAALEKLLQDVVIFKDLEELEGDALPMQHVLLNLEKLQKHFNPFEADDHRKHRFVMSLCSGYIHTLMAMSETIRLENVKVVTKKLLRKQKSDSEFLKWKKNVFRMVQNTFLPIGNSKGEHLMLGHFLELETASPAQPRH